MHNMLSNIKSFFILHLLSDINSVIILTTAIYIIKTASHVYEAGLYHTSPDLKSWQVKLLSLLLLNKRKLGNGISEKDCSVFFKMC